MRTPATVILLIVETVFQKNQVNNSYGEDFARQCGWIEYRRMILLKIAICAASGEPVLQPWHLDPTTNDLKRKNPSMPRRLCSTVYRSFQAIIDPLHSFADDGIRFWGYVPRS